MSSTRGWRSRETITCNRLATRQRDARQRLPCPEIPCSEGRRSTMTRKKLRKCLALSIPLLAKATAFAATSSQWNVDASGNWANPANWDAPDAVRGTGGVPNSIDSTARFLDVISAPRTITLDGAETIGQLQLQARQSYTFTGAGEIDIQSSVEGAANGADLNASHTISVPLVLHNLATTFLMFGSNQTLTVSGPLIAGEKTLNIFALDCAVEFRDVRAGALNVNGGTTRILPNGTLAAASRIGSISIGDQ